MRISNFSSAVCIVAVCASFISVRADDNPTQATARAALDQKMQELDAQQASTNAETPPPIVVTPSVTTQEQPATTETAPAVAPVQVPVTPMPAPSPVVTAAPEPKPVIAPAPEMPTSVNYPGKELGLSPIEAPTLPVSQDVQAQLQVLLAKYKADQISPEEYQKQRAAILAQP